MELPMDNGKKKTLTEEEEALRKSEVARRRKNQSIQRAEKDKDDTINRLLKKQASKSKRIINDDANDENGQSPAERLRRKEDPNRLHYVSNQHGSKLSIPAKFTVDQVFSQGSRSCKKAAVVCQVEGCKNLKKYVAKKSGKAVCSLEHYKVVEA
ncbi:PAPA-1-like conserved region-domain-containing protein [Phycomyces blakesleeanus]